MFVDLSEVTGGAQLSLADSIRALLRRGEHVVVVGAEGIGKVLAGESGVEMVPVPGLSLRRDGRGLTRLIWRLRPVLKTIFRQRSPEVLCANGAISALAVSLLPGGRRRNLWYERDWRTPRPVLWWLKRRFDLTLCASDFVKARAGQGAVRIYNGFDWEALRQAAQHPLATDIGSWLHNRPFVVGAGTMVRWKRWELFLDVFQHLHRQHRELAAVILGEARDEEGRHYQQRLKAYAQKQGIAEHIFWAGTRANPFSVFAQARVLCHFAECEPFGRVVCESLALGTPVVVTTDGGGPLEIGDGVRHGFQAGEPDPQKLARLVGQLMNENGVELTSSWFERFAIDRHVKELSVLLRQQKKES